jgi:hypothetical protein
MGYAIRPAVNPDFQNNIGCLISSRRVAYFLRQSRKPAVEAN